MQQQFNPVDIDARFAALVEQRNQAMNEVVYLKGAVAALTAQNSDMQAQIAELSAVEVKPADVLAEAEVLPSKEDHGSAN